MNTLKTRKLVMCALFAAICFVVTRFLSVPALYTKGYVNLGDLVVLLSAYIIGGWYGAASAAFGSALADASMGYYFYVPSTFLIKGAMVFIAALFFKKSVAGGRFKSAVWVSLGCVVAELFMAIGYFAYESILYKSVIVATASVVGNLVQGLTCVVPSVIIIMIFKKNSAVASVIKSLKK